MHPQFYAKMGNTILQTHDLHKHNLSLHEAPFKILYHVSLAPTGQEQLFGEITVPSPTLVQLSLT